MYEIHTVVCALENPLSTDFISFGVRMKSTYFRNKSLSSLCYVILSKIGFQLTSISITELSSTQRILTELYPKNYIIKLSTFWMSSQHKRCLKMLPTLTAYYIYEQSSIVFCM